MQLSYAQRLEDYHLDRVFDGRGGGFYVDIGGGHPVADNVSFAFYLKGWRGIVVEPQRSLASLYQHVRPRDIALCCLVGKSEGDVDFHVVERLHGFSTIVESHARSAREFGAGYATQRVAMRTLSAIVAEHGADDVDFLKIDVEGAEPDVLAGADFRIWRPRVIVVEAVAPGSMAEAWRSWEPALVAQGYRFAFFDGLNRFYVADEAAELARRFPAEPAAWDSAQHLWDFGRAHERTEHPDHALARRLVEGFLASLPTLSPELLADLLSSAGENADAVDLLYGRAELGETPTTAVSGESDRTRCLKLMDSDRFRAALGRIASAYDGGQIME